MKVIREGLAPKVIIILVTIFFLTLPNFTKTETEKFSYKINSQLITKLSECNADDTLTVELKIGGGITAEQLFEEMERHGGTLHEKRVYGLTRLRSIAASTQKEILTYLNQLAQTEAVEKVKSHWLTNTVSVTCQASSLNKLTQRDEVLRVFQKPVFEPISPEQAPREAPAIRSSPTTVEPNLKFIGADSAWHMGYTGKGRIVCVFELGVDGSHPALFDSWKGQDGNVTAAWDGGGDLPSGGSHGTHTVGIMVGHDDVTGDTVGVAPGAKWIASCYYDFEWAADPDDNPYTTIDMPDAVNISSYMRSGVCDDEGWEDTDMGEALGIVFTYANGNDGPEYYTSYGPGARARDTLTNFAVGSVDHNTSEIRWSSSRGPSLCDNVSIKPNVCAPGVNIRSTAPGSTYVYMGGTSMAAPHVAAAVAILRQYAPNATAMQIKEALVGGAIPAGVPYPNHHYGWGIINIPRALEYLECDYKPALSLIDWDYRQVTDKDTVAFDLHLVNLGDASDSIYVRIEDRWAGIHVLSDSFYLGQINRWDDTTYKDVFWYTYDDTVKLGTKIPMTIDFYDPGGFLSSMNVEVQAGVGGKNTCYTHETNKLEFTISNFGQYGFGEKSANDLDCSGFIYAPEGANALYEAALMIGYDSSHVSDGFRSPDNVSSNDFWQYGYIPMEISDSEVGSYQETESRFVDNHADKPMGLDIHQHTYSWDETGEDNFVILAYDVVNKSSDILEDIRIGLAFDWRIPRGLGTASGFHNEGKLGYIYFESNEGQEGYFRGLAALDREEVCAYRVKSRDYDAKVTGFTEAEKFECLRGGIVDTVLIADDGENLMQFMAVGPYTLVPGDTITTAFVVIAGDSLQQLYDSELKALTHWTHLHETSLSPRTYRLHQNYPNPFNASTTIEYTQSHRAYVTIKVYNVLGQLVKVLVDKPVEAGTHAVDWDGTNRASKPVASGVYFYQLHSGDHFETRKMVLLK